MHSAQCGINIVVEDHCCFACGVRKLVNYDLRDESIIVQLNIHPKLKMSVRTLKRRLNVRQQLLKSRS